MFCTLRRTQCQGDDCHAKGMTASFANSNAHKMIINCLGTSFNLGERHLVSN